MGCTVAAQPIGFNRTRSHSINLSFEANWKQPNQAVGSWDQFCNAAGPSGPRNTLQLLSHQVNYRADEPPLEQMRPQTSFIWAKKFIEFLGKF